MKLVKFTILILIFGVLVALPLLAFINTTPCFGNAIYFLESFILFTIIAVKFQDRFDSKIK